jgi:hypothetical protein
MNTKTKAENLRLFVEARSLRESVRSGLHRKAINASDKQLGESGSPQLHKKPIKEGPSLMRGPFIGRKG